MEKITMDGHYQTRDGLEVDVLRTDVNRARYPVVALVTEPETGQQYVRTFTSDGRFADGSETPCDLIPAPKRHTQWQNHYPHGVVSIYSTKEFADRCAGPSRIACICVTFTEGEGLEQK